MRDVIVLFSLLSLSVAIVLLASGVQRLHRYSVLEMIRLAAEISGLRDQLREMSRDCGIAELSCVAVPDSITASGQSFDVWMHDRNERAHREYMERTSRLPPCVRRTYTAAEIAEFYGVSHGGID
jgi:hypothetical protein